MCDKNLHHRARSGKASFSRPRLAPCRRVCARADPASLVHYGPRQDTLRLSAHFLQRNCRGVVKCKVAKLFPREIFFSQATVLFVQFNKIICRLCQKKKKAKNSGKSAAIPTPRSYLEDGGCKGEVSGKVPGWTTWSDATSVSLTHSPALRPCDWSNQVHQDLTDMSPVWTQFKTTRDHILCVDSMSTI